ncbi:uncharacterized protein LOC143296670 [Babylonia areolata]|uniref:uncharacterized protein LOC143296670 n=1 Tax=Babylonia areolata TaxID=304850 RepID=UPI003FD6A3CA
MLNTSLQFMFANDTATSQSKLSASSEAQTRQNLSVPSGCQEVIFSQMEYLPWDNPDNIVSAEVEEITYRMNDIMLVVLFLIGGPGNVINMAVFYKQGLKDRVNLCLFALALADELYLIVAMFHHAEQVHLQFTTKERYGPMYTFLANHNFPCLFGFVYVSSVFSAIIAGERCLCVLSPLKYQTLLRTKTMAIIIIATFVLVIGQQFIVAFRFRIGCIYDPETGMVSNTVVVGDFYKKHKEFVDNVDSIVSGVGLPGVVMIVVITATIVTAWKLRQIATWRSETTSSSISAREVALTKMLVGSSILFIVCSFPFALARFSWLLFPEMNTGRRNQNFYLTSFWVNKSLTYINSSFNIFIYYAMGSRYRETLHALFSRKAMKGDN